MAYINIQRSPPCLIKWSHAARLQTLLLRVTVSGPPPRRSGGVHRAALPARNQSPVAGALRR